MIVYLELILTIQTVTAIYAFLKNGGITIDSHLRVHQDKIKLVTHFQQDIKK